MSESGFEPLVQLQPGQCPACGALESLTGFQNEAFSLRAGKFRDTVRGLSGDQCNACREVFLDPSSSDRYAQASAQLVADAAAIAAARTRTPDDPPEEA